MPTTLGDAVPSTTVSIAPLILLSACDHYGRSAKGTRKRVVGVLLGQNSGGSVRVTNSFAGNEMQLLEYLMEDGMLIDVPEIQSPSRKTIKIRQYGSSITTTSRV